MIDRGGSCNDPKIPPQVDVKDADLLVGGESPQIPNYADALDKYIKTPRLVARCGEVI